MNKVSNKLVQKRKTTLTSD